MYIVYMLMIMMISMMAGSTHIGHGESKVGRWGSGGGENLPNRVKVWVGTHLDWAFYHDCRFQFLIDAKKGLIVEQSLHLLTNLVTSPNSLWRRCPDVKRKEIRVSFSMFNRKHDILDNKQVGDYRWPATLDDCRDSQPNYMHTAILVLNWFWDFAKEDKFPP